MRSVFEHFLRVAFPLASLILIAALVAGCGGGGSAAPAPTPSPSPTPGTTTAQVRIGDAAVDSIVDFEFSIGSPVIFTMSGATGAVSITFGQNRFELAHMAAKMEPLFVLNNVPQSSYVSAQITIQNPKLTYLDATGTPVTRSGADQTLIIPLNPPLTIGSTPTLVNLDVNVGNSIVASGGTITGFNFTPGSFSFTTKPVATETEQQDDTGEVESLVGQVLSVSGTNFTLLLTSNSQLVFATDNTTQFSGGLTSLNDAHLVIVEGVTRADGTLFAREVKGLEGLFGSELDGLITKITGSPIISFDLMAQDGIGNGMDPAKIGANFRIDLGLATQYSVDQGKCDFSGLGTVGGATSADFPFDAASLHAGQRVEVLNSGGVPAPGGSELPDAINLEQQAISGTASKIVTFTSNAGTSARFDLTVPPDSDLAVLSGQTVVHVFQQPGTDNKFGPISNNSAVRVRGLLFWTGTAFNMIARRITAP